MAASGGGQQSAGRVEEMSTVVIHRLCWCRRWCAVLMYLAGIGAAVAAVENGNLANSAVSGGSEDYLVKQVVWKKCHRKLTPACLKLSLVRTVEMMSKDAAFVLVPGVSFSSNSSAAVTLPPDLARSLSQDQPPIDDLVSFSLGRYVRSLTLNVNLVDFFSGGNETLQNSVMDAFSGRAKGGFGGYGAVVAVIGGSMASMMLAALAALAGKALMTSMAALMMAAMAAMKGNGGGGGGEHKTYEVITKPIVSHVNTHSSEVQHEHGHHGGHYRKRSLERGVVEEGAVEEGKWGLEPYLVYSTSEENRDNQRDKMSFEEPEEKNTHHHDEEKDLHSSPNEEASMVKTFVEEELKDVEPQSNEDTQSTMVNESLRGKRSVGKQEETLSTSEEEIVNFYNQKGSLQEIQRRYPRSLLDDKENGQLVSGHHPYLYDPNGKVIVKRSADFNIINKQNPYGYHIKNVIPERQIRSLKEIPEVNHVEKNSQSYHRNKRSPNAENFPDSKIYHIRLRPEDQKVIPFELPFVGHPPKHHGMYKRFANNNVVKPYRVIR